MKTTLEILKGARALLAIPGVWWNGKGRKRKNQYCMVQAVTEQSHLISERSGVYRKLWPFTDSNVVRFNDARERTLDEVLTVFDKAIAAEEQNETV